MPFYEKPEWIIVFVTVAYVIIAGLTLRAIKRQADIASDTAQRQLRAYICLDTAALHFPTKNSPVAMVNFKNCGQTPAYEVHGWIHTWITTHPLQEKLPALPIDYLMIASNTLGPGTLTKFVAPKKPPLLGFVASQLGTPQCTYYVYGQILYRDIFGKERYTNYRLLYGGPEGVHSNRNGDGDELWILCPDTKGNEAD